MMVCEIHHLVPEEFVSPPALSAEITRANLEWYISVNLYNFRQ